MGDKNKLDFQQAQLSTQEEIADWQIGLQTREEVDYQKYREMVGRDVEKEIELSAEDERRDDKEKHLLNLANIRTRKRYLDEEEELDEANIKYREEQERELERKDEALFGLLKNKEYLSTLDEKEKEFIDKENDKARDELLRQQDNRSLLEFGIKRADQLYSNLIEIQQEKSRDYVIQKMLNPDYKLKTPLFDNNAITMVRNSILENQRKVWKIGDDDEAEKKAVTILRQNVAKDLVKETYKKKNSYVKNHPYYSNKLKKAKTLFRQYAKRSPFL